MKSTGGNMQSTEKILADLAKEIKCGSALYQNRPDKSDYYISRILTLRRIIQVAEADLKRTEKSIHLSIDSLSKREVVLNLLETNNKKT